MNEHRHEDCFTVEVALNKMFLQFYGHRNVGIGKGKGLSMRNTDSETRKKCQGPFCLHHAPKEISAEALEEGL